MGQGQSPTSEELKFIYNLLRQGYSDADIIRQYRELKQKGKLGSLPERQDIRFIRQRRKEYEVARTVLEPHLQKLADPIIAKAREEHLNSIHSLIAEWFSVLDYPKEVSDLSMDKPHKDRLYKAMTNIEANAFFECLKSHIPSDGLWQSYAFFARKYPDYLNLGSELISEVREAGAQWPNLLKIGRDFEKPILHLIFVKDLKDSKVIGEDEPYYRIIWEPVAGDKPFLRARVGDPDNPRWVVLVADHPEVFIKDYNALANQVLQSKKANDLLEMYSQLWNSCDDIYQTLQDALLSYSYLNHVCKFCPGSTSN
jgi:hypothetical protein